MPNYRRVFVPGGCYFFTVNLLERKRTLLTDHIDLLRDSVRTVRRLYPFHIDAWVVLPDYMHCVLTLPPDSDDYPLRWRLIKLLFPKVCRRPNDYRQSVNGATSGASGKDGIGSI
jgi:putative transposase